MMSTQSPPKTLLVNASRVPPVGGLYAFTATVLRSVAGRYTGVKAVVGPQTQAPAGVERIQAPAAITIQNNVSLLRSVYGFLYSILLSWRYRRHSVLTTTNLGLPMHRDQVIVLHDVRPLLMPYTWGQRLYYRYVLPRMLQSVKGVLTVSHSSKEAIAQMYAVAPERIFVVPNVIRTVAEAEIALREPGEAAYLLMVNANFRHKNAGELLEQHALWRPQYRLKVLAGGGGYETELRRQVQRLGLDGQVDFLPYKSEAELAALYKHAAALVFPSLMEGFGIPPVEAMAYGTPVIVSDIAVFREVLGDAPIFVTLGDAESWKQAFDALSSGAMAEHVRKGREIAAQFTQERVDALLKAALETIWRPAGERAMRVMIDTTTVGRVKAGVGVYVTNLIDHLIEIPGNVHYFIVAQSDDADFAHEGLPHVTMVYVPAALYRIRPVRILLEQIWLPVLVLRHRIDVLHSVHYSFPLFCPRAKRAVTIHDMTSVTMPEMHIGAKRIHYRFFIAAALRFAEMMIFVSHSSLKDCQRLFHLRDERAEVIHLGLEDRWYRMAAEGAPAGSEWVTKLPKQFVLFVGMIEPRKNIARLVLAFAAVAKEYPECVLVIAGKKGWKYEEVFVNARESGVEERIHFTGFVSDEDKMALMGRATVFAYPSLYEGFGIPVLEALACGVPTLTSDVSSIPEVTGDAALLVNPESTEEIATALRRLLSDTDLREELRTKGMKRAKLFPWSATAERTLGVYEALYAKQRG